MILFCFATRIVADHIRNAHFVRAGEEQTYSASDLWSWVDEVGECAEVIGDTGRIALRHHALNSMPPLPIRVSHLCPRLALRRSIAVIWNASRSFTFANPIRTKCCCIGSQRKCSTTFPIVRCRWVGRENEC